MRYGRPHLMRTTCSRYARPVMLLSVSQSVCMRQRPARQHLNSIHPRPRFHWMNAKIDTLDNHHPRRLFSIRACSRWKTVCLGDDARPHSDQCVFYCIQFAKLKQKQTKKYIPFEFQSPLWHIPMAAICVCTKVTAVTDILVADQPCHRTTLKLGVPVGRGGSAFKLFIFANVARSNCG